VRGEGSRGYSIGSGRSFKRVALAPAGTESDNVTTLSHKVWRAVEQLKADLSLRRQLERVLKKLKCTLMPG